MLLPRVDLAGRSVAAVPRPDPVRRRPSRRALLLGAAAVGLAGCGDGTGSAVRTPSAGGSRTPTNPAPSSPAVTPTTMPGSLRRAVRNSGGDVVHAVRTVNAVALTFHGAGDPALTRRVLAELSAAGAAATVFAVGSWLDTEPALAAAVLDGGHELGNHTYHHLPMRTLSAAAADVEVSRAAAVLTRLVGNHGAWFRPSGTASSTAVIRSAARRSGYPVCVSYDLDSLDWTDPGPAAVIATVATAGPGSIISLHLGHLGTAQALPTILAHLHARALRPVTVSALLA